MFGMSDALARTTIGWMVTRSRFRKRRSQWTARRCLQHLMTTPRKCGVLALIGEFAHSSMTPRSLAQRPKGLRIVTLSGHSAWLWGVCNQSCFLWLFRLVTSLDAAFTPDGEFAWASRDSSQALWHSPSGRQWSWLRLADQTSFAFSHHPGGCKGGERKQYRILFKSKASKQMLASRPGIRSLSRIAAPWAANP